MSGNLKNLEKFRLFYFRYVEKRTEHPKSKYFEGYQKRTLCSVTHEAKIRPGLTYQTIRMLLIFLLK